MGTGSRRIASPLPAEEEELFAPFMTKPARPGVFAGAAAKPAAVTMAMPALVPAAVVKGQVEAGIELGKALPKLMHDQEYREQHPEEMFGLAASAVVGGPGRGTVKVGSAARPKVRAEGPRAHRRYIDQRDVSPEGALAREHFERLTLPERVKQFPEAYRDPLTGAYNRRAYTEMPHKPFEASIDIDSLKWVNEAAGHAAGDKMIQEVVKALGKDVYRMGGDEFTIRAGSTLQLEAKVARANEILAGKSQEVVTLAGKRVVIPMKISHGVGRTAEAADVALRQSKIARERAGVRAPRGEQAAGVTARPRLLAAPREDLFKKGLLL